MQADLEIFNNSAVGRLMRQYNWSESPLGNPAFWPQSLKTLNELLLNTSTPNFIAWGDELCLLYNDAYLPVLGQKHPAALGRPLQESWSEIWDEIRPLMQRVLQGESVHFEDHAYEIFRNGKIETAWFSFSYTPIHDDHRKIAGLYCALHETTSAVLAKKAKQEETEKLYRLFEETPGFMAVLRGPNHVYELANHSYLQLVGQRNLVGLEVRDAIPELKEQGFFEILDNVYQTGERYVGRRLPVDLLRSARLEQRFVDFVFQPIREHDGAVSGIFIQGNDVTDHVLAESRWRDAARQAEEAKERLDVMLATVPVGIAVADANGNVLEMNPANAEIWGIIPPATGSAVENRDWKGWWADGSARHAQPIAAHEWTMARVLRGEQAKHDVIEIEPFNAPGSRKVILNSGAPILDANGNVIGGVVAQMDITEQVRTEAALRESEAKFRAIADTIPQLIWSNLPNGEHDYYNQRWKDFTGFAKGLNDPLQWQELVHPDDRRSSGERWQHSLMTGEPYEMEYRIRHNPTGEYRWALARAMPIRDRSGKILRWMGTCTDIHDQKLSEEELKLGNQRKDEFLAMLAHELRNPLAPISTAATLLSMSGMDEKRIRHSSEVISRQVKHMTELVNDLLDVSRVTRGLVTLEKELVDLKSVIASAVEQARPLIENRRHVLHTRIGAEEAYVIGDRTRLIQVLVNLLTNAAKYTPQGGEIVLGLEVRDGEIKVCVSDNGNGIDQRLLPHIFDLFTQGERTPDRSQGGLGLGLALVKSLMALHGGHVDANSEGPGNGSKFMLYFPAITRKDAQERHDESQAVQERKLRSLRLMIVDDNLDAAESLGAVLEANGHQVTVTENATAALKQAEVDPPQVYILDIGLPDMDGYTLARRLREKPINSHATMIALTGYGQTHDREQAKAAGFDHHFVKPMDTEQLENILSTVH